MYKLHYDTVNCYVDRMSVLELYSHRCLQSLSSENMENKIKKKTLLASILITEMKLPLPSMGTEFCNQCCQSPSGLTFLSHLNLTIESFLSGIPSATQFLLTCFQRQPLHLLSCPLLCSKQPLKSPFSLQ